MLLLLSPGPSLLVTAEVAAAQSASKAPRGSALEFAKDLHFKEL